MGIGVPPRPERLGGEYGTLTGTETDARTRPTRAKGGLGRGLHPERWGRVAFVWPEKPFRAVGDGCPGTKSPGGVHTTGGGRGLRLYEKVEHIVATVRGAININICCNS